MSSCNRGAIVEMKRMPLKPAAFRFTELSYLDVLQKDLKVMDMTAITLCKENKLPILVFNMNTKGNFKRLILGENVGTTVQERSSSAR